MATDSPKEILKALKKVDGSGSGLDADTLRGLSPAQIEASASNAILLTNLDTNVALGSSDTKVPSQKAVKAYVDGKAFSASASGSAPASASATGTAGSIAYDATHIYVCIATDTWVRATLATWS